MPWHVICLQIYLFGNSGKNMAEGSDKITITIKTPREKKDVTVKEDSSVKEVRAIDYLL